MASPNVNDDCGCCRNDVRVLPLELENLLEYDSDSCTFTSL